MITLVLYVGETCGYWQLWVLPGRLSVLLITIGSCEIAAFGVTAALRGFGRCLLLLLSGTG